VHWEKIPKDQKRITYSPNLIVRRASKRVHRVGMQLPVAPFGRQPLPARIKPVICEKKFPNAGHGPPKYPLGESEPGQTGSAQSWLSPADFVVIYTSAYKRHLSLVGDNWDNGPNCAEWHGIC
jgi:hypothetical protein